MASDSEASNIFRSPLMLGLITLLLLLFVGLAGNIYLMGSGNGENPHLFKASVLKATSQAIAKHAGMAMAGTRAAISELDRDRESFESTLASLRSVPQQAQSSLSQVTALWSELTPALDILVDRQGAINEIFGRWNSVWRWWQHGVVNWLKKPFITCTKRISQFNVNNVPGHIT